MSMTDYLENEILDHIFGRAWTNPTTLWLGISKADPTETGSAATEPFSSGNAYARIPTIETDWAVSSGGVIVNSSSLTFPTAGSNWGIHSFAVLSTVVSGGPIIWQGTLTTSKDISTGDTMCFSAGDCRFTLD